MTDEQAGDPEGITIEDIAKAAEEAFGEAEVSGFAAGPDMYAQMGISFLNNLSGLGKGPLSGCFTQGCKEPHNFRI